MKTLLPVWGVTLLLVVTTRGQSSPGFYFPQQPQPPQSSNSGGGEFLGNYFNDNANLPSITTSSQPTFSSPPPQNQFRYQPQVPQTFSSGPPQFTNQLNQNYITNAPPSSNANANSIPRETHFFGNNYDFFRSFHLDAAPQRPPTFQPIQPYRSSQPSFNPSVGNSHQATPASTPTAAPTKASIPSFSTNQFFDNPFSTHAFSNARPTAPVPTVTYNYINGQPAQNSLFNSYEDAAKQLGVTHGLRVFTTETIRVKPTSSLATIPQEISTEPSSTVAAVVEDKRIDDDDALTLSPPVSTLTPSPSPSTTTASPSTTPAPAPTIIIRNTGRSVATPVVRSRLVSSSVTPLNLDGSPVKQSSASPNVAVVSHSREPLFTANASPNVVSGVDAFPGRGENDFEQSRPQQRPQRPVTPRVAVTTREPTRPTPPPTPPAPQTTQQPRLRTTQPPPPPPSPTFSGEKPLYNNANYLVPGQLYSNTNGAYQHYYGPGSQSPQRPPMRGLEEIEPQIIDFPIPIHKMIPVLEQHFRNEEYDPYRRPHSFDTFGPPGGPSSFPQPPSQQQPQYRPQSKPFNSVTPSSLHPQPFNRPPLISTQNQPQQLISQAPVVIVTESALPDLSTPPTTNQLEETVVRVGPKGRLLKKRRKVRPQSAQVPQQQQRSATTEVRPTTYRPPVETSEDQEEPQPATTYRSRFRFSPTTSTTSTESPSAGSVAISEGDKSLIASRLKSVERQIRFRHRNKNT